MKTLTLSISKALMGFLILLSLHGNAQWSKQITPDWISDVHMADQYNGFAVGWGEIYKTNDGGSSWNLSKSVTYGGLLGLYVSNKDTAFAFGVSSDMYHTFNAGSTWNAISSPLGDDYEMIGITKDSFLLVGDDGIWQSVNGGMAWQNVLANIKFNDVQYVNKSTTYACGNGIYNTADNGSTWKKMANDTIYRISFLNDSVGYGVKYYSNMIVKTIDAGLNWSPVVELPWSEFGYLTDIVAYSNYIMVACSSNYFTYAYSNDNGSNWFKYIDNASSFGMDDIDVLNDSMVWCSGNTGLFFSSTPFSGGTALNTDSVWPGDANADKTANIYDALNIGIAYNETGTIRAGASLNWVAQSVSDWGKTFNNGLDYKHADCNGNGKIDTNDVQAILLNYGLTHNKTDNSIVATAADPLLYLEFPEDSVAVGTSISIPIYFGTSSLSVDSLYGLAFSINYDTTLIKSASVTANFNNSWLGTINANMFSVSKNLPDNERIDIAISRTDHQNKLSSYGQIGELNIVTSDNISGKLLITKTLQLNISNAKAITASGTSFLVNTAGDSVVVADSLAGFPDILIDSKAISVYPNPAKNNISIQANGASIKSVTMYNMLGKNEVSLSGHINRKLQINLTGYPAGMYMLQIETDKGIVIKKFSKE